MSSLTTAPTKNKFSIFNSLITNDHREFYERITNELMSIAPICNQGKSTAAEISETATEQEQITDLMARVETFAEELHDGTKNLFDQFYQAKEDFCKSIYCTTAYIKINLIDRTLLERTCDVRWWAMEAAFVQCLETVKRLSKSLDNMLGEINEYLDAAKTAFEVPTLETNWTMKDISKYVDEVSAYSGRKADLMYSDRVYSEFKAKVEALSAQLGKGKNQETTLKMLTKLLTQLDEVHASVNYACSRLEDIRSSYTLYSDLVITTPDGVIVANSNVETRPHILGKSVAGELWFERAIKSRDGSDYAIEQVSDSQVSAGNTLACSTAVRKSGSLSETAIGSMGAFFDLEEEAKIILNDYMPCGADDRAKAGWFSFFTNTAGVVVGSSDLQMIPPGDYAQLPSKHRNLKEHVSESSYAVVQGTNSTIFSAKSDGYMDFPGLQWSSHLVVPTVDIFESDVDSRQEDIDCEDLMRSKLIPAINKETYVKVQDDKQSIKLISLNGIVFASKLGKRGVALGPVFDRITQTGDFATSKMEELLREMASGELKLNLKTLETFSKQAIDLIDRNLFERSAAIQWWSTDQFLWKACAEPTVENISQAMHRLRDINGSYSIYRNLILADRMGRILTASTPELIPDVKEARVADHPWFVGAMRNNNSVRYCVQDVGQSELERAARGTMVFSGAVRQNGERENEIIGVLGSLFDWVTESGKILKTCLPKDKNGKRIEGCVAFYANQHLEVIESTDKEKIPLGSIPDLPEVHSELNAGDSSSGVLKLGDDFYIIGSSRSKGYREYAGLGWYAHILRPLF
jgi:hypothetical protein